MTTTLAHLLEDRARADSEGVALRYHRLGIWEEVSWGELHEHAARVGAGLVALGVGEGDIVAVVATNQPRWIATDLGVQGAGAISLAVDPDISPATLARLLGETGAVAAVVGDQEQYDKVTEAWSSLPALRKVVVMDTRGIRHLDDEDRPDTDRVLTFAQLERLGKDREAWDATARSLAPEQPATIEVALGASTAPVTRTHGELVAAARALHGALAMRSSDELYPQVSFADPVARALCVTGLLSEGYTIAIGEAGRVVFLEMNAAQPTLVHADPSWLARMAGDVRQRTSATTGVKRLALRRGLRPRPPATEPAAPGVPATRVVGAVLAVAILGWLLLTPDMVDGARIAVAALLAFAAGAVLVLAGLGVQGPLRRRYGLSRARAVCVSRPVPEDVAHLLGALGVPLVVLEPAIAGRAQVAEERQ